MKSFILFSISFFTLFAMATPKYSSIGIMGDSITTGAGSNPKIKLTLNKLVSYVIAEAWEPKQDTLPDFQSTLYADLGLSLEQITSPMRIYFDPSEMQQRKLQDLQLEALGSSKLDFEEQSFGYLLGKMLNIDSDNIVLVGQDGKRINHALTQFRRLSNWKGYKITRAWTPTAFDMNRYTVKTEYVGGPQELPDLVLMSFVANDMCNKNIFEMTPEALYQKYFQELLNTYKDVVTSMKPATNGTDIIFVTAVDPIQALDNPEVLNTAIEFESEPATCQDVRNRKDKQKMNFIEGMCNAILATPLDDKVRIEKLRNYWLAVKKAQEDATYAAQSWKASGFNFKVLSTLSNFTLKKGEVANDCFHPSFKGHARMAKELYNDINKLNSTKN